MGTGMPCPTGNAMVGMLPGKHADRKQSFGQGVGEDQVVEDQTEVSPSRGSILPQMGVEDVGGGMRALGGTADVIKMIRYQTRWQSSSSSRVKCLAQGHNVSWHGGESIRQPSDY